jgi:hypothetical protein
VIVDRRATAASPRLRPLAPNQLSVPTQKRLRRHDQRVSPPPREHPGERSKKGTIGRPQRRPTRLPPEHDELMPGQWGRNHDDLAVVQFVPASVVWPLLQLAEADT